LPQAAKVLLGLFCYLNLIQLCPHMTVGLFTSVVRILKFDNPIRSEKFQ